MLEGESTADLGATAPGGLTDSSTKYETAGDLTTRPAAKPKYGRRMLAGGFLVFRRTWPIVGAAWHDAVLAAQAAEKSR